MISLSINGRFITVAILGNLLLQAIDFFSSALHYPIPGIEFLPVTPIDSSEARYKTQV